MIYKVIKIDKLDKQNGEVIWNKFSQFVGLAKGVVEEAVVFKLKKVLKEWYKEECIAIPDTIFGIYRFRNNWIQLRGFIQVEKEEYNILKKYLMELK